MSEPHSPASEHNKPMVPTAPASPAVNPSRPPRRHIGQPLGGVDDAISRDESADLPRERRRAGLDGVA